MKRLHIAIDLRVKDLNDKDQKWLEEELKEGLQDFLHNIEEVDRTIITISRRFDYVGKGEGRRLDRG